MNTRPATTSGSSWLPALFAFLAFLGVPSAAQAADTLDWSAWRQLPVFDHGRIMPLDTFARDAVSKICGRVNPRLSLPDDERDASALSQARELFPDGKARKFTAAELLLSWIVEPEKWEHVPFLRAEHHALREDLMRLPLRDGQGNPLKYVSPHQVMVSVDRQEGLIQTLREVDRKQGEARAQGKAFVAVGVERKAKELEDAFSLFRLLSFNPTTGAGDRGQRVRHTLMRSLQLWQELAVLFEQAQEGRPDEQLAARIHRVTEAAKHVARAADRGDPQLSEIEPLVGAYHKSAVAVAESCSNIARQLFDKPASDRTAQVQRRLWNETASKSVQLVRLCEEARLALYDNGQSLRVVPALHPAALQSTRDSGDDAQPWLDLRLVVNGSGDLLQAYPQNDLHAVREALAQVKAAYTGHDPDRVSRFAQAMKQFASALRTLGNHTDKLRQEMSIPNRDDATIRATAYPGPGFTRAEVHYNQLDPFFWSWVISLGALACLAMSFGILRVPMFWLGVAVLLAGQAFTLYGFGLRACITGWVPVAGMFETIVFVSFTAALMGLWLTLAPLLAPGGAMAWQAWAMPGTWESRGQPGMGSFLAAAPVRFGLLAIRVGLTVFVFYCLAFHHHGTDADARAYFSLFPKAEVGSWLPSLNNLITWGVGLCVLVPIVWYVPRAVLAAVLLPVAIPLSMRRMDCTRAWDHVRQRKLFALVGAFLAFFVAYITDWMPLEQKGLGQMAAVLRDNFWLTIHVLTITASYSAGALAWGLGNIALGYYLFGRYREPAQGTIPRVEGEMHRPADGYEIPPDAQARLSPESCIALGGFIYKAIQVAVLLLAAGTIFGALWADVAWGRFWSWDAKEVWALVSLLVYMAILHGRSAGWFGNFGLACGAVAGATAIVMAWYGANYWFPSGRHAYAPGEGGQWEVGIALSLNWLFLLAASVRQAIARQR